MAEKYLNQQESLAVVVSWSPQSPGSGSSSGSKAHETGRQILSNEECWGEQACHTVGYTTHVSYTLPSTESDADVVAFYTQRMRGWRRESWTVDRLRFACFDRNGATVGIDTTGMELLGGATRKMYGIAVTHAGGTCD